MGGASENTPTTSQYLIRLPEPKIDNKKFVWEDHTQHRGHGWGNQDPSTGDRGAGAAEQSRDQSVGDSTFETRQLSGREPAPPHPARTPRFESFNSHHNRRHKVP